MASAEVLTTYELIENIALNLPLRDIILAQNISKSFHHVINRSPAIKRALFLAPTTNKSLESFCRSDGSIVWKEHEQGALVAPMFNPLVAVRNYSDPFVKHSTTSNFVKKDRLFFSGPSKTPFSYLVCQNETLPRVASSRDKMSVSHPPIRCLRGVEMDSAAPIRIFNPDGITVADVLNAVSAFSRTHNRGKEAWFEFGLEGNEDYPTIRPQRNAGEATGMEMLEILGMSQKDLLRDYRCR